jgi:hypothetical protein
MKTLTTCLFAIVSVFLCLCLQDTCLAQTFTKAGDYLQNISTQFSAIRDDTWDYTSAVAHSKSAKKIENKRKELLKTISAAQKKISNMSAYDGDAGLRDSVVSFLTMDYNIINYDYAKIVDMEEIAEQSYDQMEAYLLAQEKANNKLDAANDNLLLEQQKFAEAHNINLIENKDKISKKLEKSGLVFSYYNKIYLIFFKSYKQEAYLLDAMNKSDVNSIEQNKNTLILYDSIGLSTLDTMRSFKGDASLKTACKAVLNFYKTEAGSKLKDISDYYISKEKFDKIKTAFEAKSESSRTKADVDKYNAAVAEINKTGKKYQLVNDDLNLKRNTAVENWNTAVKTFLDKQVPKYK